MKLTGRQLALLREMGIQPWRLRAASSEEEIWRELEARAKRCTACDLANSRTQVVFGVGNRKARWFLVGEAPGEQEDLKGEPFVGRAGKLLDEMLFAIGTSRKEVYITNVVKCLRDDTPVQLGNGEWEQIHRLVRARYGGEVMSVDREGRLVRRRVVGWHASPLGKRRVFRLTYLSAKAEGRVSTQLTEDHPVLTQRGFVPVSQLREDDLVATGRGLSPHQLDLICGSLLGDGPIRATGSSFVFSHRWEQRDYALFKATLLGELSPSVRPLLVSVAGGGSRATVEVEIRADGALRLLWHQFYGVSQEAADRKERGRGLPRSLAGEAPDGKERGGGGAAVSEATAEAPSEKGPFRTGAQPAQLLPKRVPPWLASRLNERMVAVWFMESGHLRPGQRPFAEIATGTLDRDDLAYLLEGLERLQLYPEVRLGRLHFDRWQTLRLSERIAPFVPPPMRYKLHPEVERRTPYDPSRWSPSPPVVLYDRVEVEEITDRFRADKSFYCLDVEETHNFVTAGGVVHNCRPPNNRDPLPQEIAACRPFLEEQIRLVSPKLILAVGRIAAQSLLETKAPLSRLRGKVHRFGTIPLVVLYHPAYLLRNPIAKREAWEDLKLALSVERPTP